MIRPRDTYPTLRRFMAGATAGLCLVVGGAASAQTPDLVEVEGELTVVTGISDGQFEADANAHLRATTSTVLENGLELGAAAAVTADSDEPGYKYIGGRYSSFLAGGPRGFGPDSGDVFLDGAYVFARGGFGTLHLGRDEGVASRLAVTSPTIFRAVGVNDWETDFTGLNDVHTVNDFSGSAAKVSYMAPAGMLGGLIGQLQLGLSYAPEISGCEDEACGPVRGFVIGADSAPIEVEQSWKDVLEAALYYQKGIDVGEHPLTLGLSASYVQAEDDGTAIIMDALQPLFGDYEAYAFGVNLAYGSVTLGGSVKSTTTGLAEDRDEDYLAFDAGLTYETGEWNFMLGYGAADAERDAALLISPDAQSALIGLGLGLDRQTQTAQAGVSYVFDHGFVLGAAAQFVDSDKSDALGGPEDAAAIVFESSIKF